MEDSESISQLLSRVNSISSAFVVLQRDVRELTGEDELPTSSHLDNKKVTVLTDEQKRQMSKSSWARSTLSSERTLSRSTNGGGVIAGMKRGHNEVVDNTVDSVLVSKADRARRKQSPAYSFGYRRPVKDEAESVAGLPHPMTYHVKEDLLSTRSRTKGGKFPLSARNTDAVDGIPSSIISAGDAMVGSHGDIPETEEVVMDYITDGGHSFGKADRFKQTNSTRLATEANQGDKADVSEIALLDVERARDVTRPHVATAIIRNPTAPSSAAHANIPQANAIATVHDEGSGDVSKKLDCLSTRFRSPAPSLYNQRKSSGSNSITANSMEIIVNAQRSAEKEMAKTPGPGSYWISDRALTATKKGYGVRTGTVIHGKEKSTPRPQSAKIDKSKAAELGPGCYNTATTRGVLSTERRVPASAIYRNTEADSKSNPHLTRKRYFEQKARDMREAYDYQHLPDDSMLRPRIPVARVVNTRHDRTRPRSAESDRKDAKSRLIWEIDRALEEEEKKYSINYELVEHRSSTPVNWRAETDARKRTMDHLQKVPRAYQRLQESAEEAERSKQRFYGPQLPVQWVQDKAVLRSQRGRYRESSGSRSNSPAREVLEMLGEVDKRPKPDDHDEYTEAFLQSSYSGALRKPGYSAAVDNFNPNSKSGPINRDSWINYGEPSAKERDFLSSQLQPDWTASESSHNMTNRTRRQGFIMSNIPGREEVRVISKGIKLTKSFTEGGPILVEEEDGLAQVTGPGLYDTTSGKSIATAPVKGVPFSKSTAREPSFEGQVGDGEDREGQILDIDYGQAKDMVQGRHRNRAPQLYRKDRYEDDVQDVDNDPDAFIQDPKHEHLGGSWFESDFDQIIKNKRQGQGVVDFSKMTSRPNDIVSANDEEGQDGRVLDLQVHDWQPHKSNLDGKVLGFGDPANNPRFPQSNTDIGHQLDLDPMIARDKMKDKRVSGVDLTKMQGRSLNGVDVSRAAAMNDVNGSVDLDLAVALGREKADDIARGINAVKKRRDKGFVEFSKQSHRLDEERNRQELLQVQGEGSNTLYNDKELLLEESKTNKNAYKNGKGIVDWNLLQGRDDITKAKDTIQINTEGSEQLVDELKLAPKVDGLSKYKNAPRALDWNKHNARSALNNELTVNSHGSVTEKGQPQEGRVLDLDEVDPGDFKKKEFNSLALVQKKGQNINMSNQLGRQLVPSSIEDGSLFAKEELILDHIELAKDNSKVRPRAAISMQNKGDLVYEHTPSLTAEEVDYHNTEVILDPKKVYQDSFDMEKNNTIRKINNKEKKNINEQNLKNNLRLSTAEQYILRELNQNQEELDLNPKYPHGIGEEKTGYTTMSDKDKSRGIANTRVAMTANEDGSLQPVEALRLDPSDQTIKKKSRGTTLASKTERFRSPDEVKVIKELEKQDLGELKLDPSDKPARTNPARPSSMQNKEKRFVDNSSKIVPNTTTTKENAKKVKSDASLTNTSSLKPKSVTMTTKRVVINAPAPSSSLKSSQIKGKETPQGKTIESPYQTPKVNVETAGFPVARPPSNKKNSTTALGGDEPTADELLQEVNMKLKELGLA